MSTTRRDYSPKTDFLKVRDFLVETFKLYGRPFNWMLDRWNFARYFVTPVHTYYNVSYFSVPGKPDRVIRDEVKQWEQSIRVWENSDGETVAVLLTENEEPGEAWIQIHPNHRSLYPEVVDIAEAELADVDQGVGYLKLYIWDSDQQLQAEAQSRGYRKLPVTVPMLRFNCTDAPEPRIPDGYTVKTVDELGDLEKLRKAKVLSFGSGYGPSAWPPASAYVEMMKAPDYDHALDLVVEAPDGEVASFCTIWIDLENRYGNFEPVGTTLHHQGKGLARNLLYYGLRLMGEHGATHSYMDSRQEFYPRVGFKATGYSYTPWYRHWQA